MRKGMGEWATVVVGRAKRTGRQRKGRKEGTAAATILEYDGGEAMRGFKRKRSSSKRQPDLASILCLAFFLSRRLKQQRGPFKPSTPIPALRAPFLPPPPDACMYTLRTTGNRLLFRTPPLYAFSFSSTRRRAPRSRPDPKSSA